MDSIINKSCCFTGHRKIDSDEYDLNDSCGADQKVSIVIC